MTKINVTKEVAYTALQQTWEPETNVAKGVAYTALQKSWEPQVNVTKEIAYTAILTAPIFGVNTTKVSAYTAILPDTSGNARQATNANRPIYKTGTIPYVQFSAGQSLEVSVLFAGDYTAIYLMQDGSFKTETVALVAGPNVLPAYNFNQAALVPGILSRLAIASIKLSMQSRV